MLKKGMDSSIGCLQALEEKNGDIESHWNSQNMRRSSVDQFLKDSGKHADFDVFSWRGRSAS